MIKKIVTAVVGSIVLASSSYGQVGEKCAVYEGMKKAIAINPAAQDLFNLEEQNIQKRTAEILNNSSNSAMKTTDYDIYIPLVFHVVLSQSEIDQIGGTAGIYDRVTSQIEVLNADFNAASPDTVPTIFQSLKGNAHFHFGLAHTRPDGKGTIGIEIKIAPSTYGGFEANTAGVKKASLGGLDNWDQNKYLNVWVTNITNGSSPGKILGFGYSPAVALAFGDAALTGVVLDYSGFGKKKLIGDYFTSGADKGRTLVHEMGHYFTLFHIWGNTAVGSGTCSDDDGIGDTPQQKDANQSTCPNFPKANCTNSNGGEMFMNFMDYAGDACTRMFTKGQVARMQSEFATGGGSYNLQFQSGLMAWPTEVSTLTSKNTIDIYPNPSNGVFNLAFTNTEDIKSITVFSQFGQIIKEVSIVNNAPGMYKIDLTGFAKGIYNVRCSFENSVENKKIVLE